MPGAAHQIVLAALWDTFRSIEIPIFSHTQVARTWGFRERRIDEHLIYLVTNGAFRCVAGPLQADCGVGDLLWLPPRLAHTFALLPGRGLRVVHLRFAVAGDPGTGVGPLLLRHAQDLLPLIQACRARHRQGFALDQPGRALLYALLATVTERATAAAEVDGLSPQHQRRLDAWLDEHWRHDPRPAELAGLLGLSLDYTTRRFRASYGAPPRTWLLAYRLRRIAELLLDSSEPIAGMAASCGFPDPARFSRQFRQVLGLSPRQWRQRHQAARKQSTARPSRAIPRGPGRSGRH